MTLLLSIRLLLSRENKKREHEMHDDSYDNVHIERIGVDGEMIKVKIDKVCGVPFVSSSDAEYWCDRNF